MVRKDGQLTAVSWGEALGAAAEIIRSATERGPEGLGAIGGAQLTNEGAYAWTALLKGVVGTDSVDAQLGDGLDAAHVLGLPRASIDDAASACTIILLAGDLREELPVLFLRLRSAAVSKRSSIIDLGPRSSSLSELAAVRLPARPGDAPAIARALAGDASGLGRVTAHPEGRTFSDADLDRARSLIGDDGEGVVIVLGRSSVAEDASFVEAAARSLAAALPKARFLPALRRGNVLGALDMGMSPGILPGRVGLDTPSTALKASWPTLPAAHGRSSVEQLSSLADGSQRALLLLGADPTSDLADAALVERAMGAGAPIIVVAGHGGAALADAAVVLPAAVAHERGGTTTNIEGRVTRLVQKLVAPGQAWPDWMIAAELAAEMGADLGVTTSAQVTNQIARVAPSHAGLDSAALEAPGAVDGLLVPLSRSQAVPTDQIIDPIAVPGLSAVTGVGLGAFVGAVRGPVHVQAGDAEGLLSTASLSGLAAPEAPAPDSYSLRLVATRTLYDNGTAVSASPSLSVLRPAVVARANPYDLDRIGAASGSQVTLRSAAATLIMEVEADPGVLRGTLAVDAGLSDGSAAGASAVAALVSSGELVTDVRMESR
jgi:NADH-quinone oxidoreductase subunit G